MNRRNFRQAGNWSLILVLSLVIICGFSLTRSGVTVTHAEDTPTPTPTPDEEKDRLQRAADLAKLKQDKAEADQKTAEARKAEFEAKFPKPTTSPLEGKTTVEGAVIESQMISYVSLARAGDRVFEAIKQAIPSGGTLAIYNEQDVNLMLSYQVATSQVNELIGKGYCQILTSEGSNGICPTPTPTPSPSPSPGASPSAEFLPPPPVAGLAIAQSFLGAFVDMTGLLRTNVEIKGQTFTIDEAPLAAEIFRCARGEHPRFEPNNSPLSTKCANENKTLTLFYPYVFPPNVHADQESELLQLLETTHKLHGDALQVIDTIENYSKQIEKADADIKALEAAIEGLPKDLHEAMTVAGIGIKANCRRLSADVDSILAHPENQSEAMKRLIDRAIKTCPRMAPDKVAQLLGMQKTIGDIESELADSKTALEKAKGKKTDAEKDLKAELAKLRLKRPGGSDAQLKNDATAVVAQLKAINAQFDNLVTTLVQPQAGGVNPLTNFIRTERLSSALGTKNPEKSFWLVVKVINAGGNNRIKTNPIVDIFRGGNRLSHSGGVIAQYHLFKSNGVSVRSGTVSDYTNYINAEKVTKITGSGQ
jgi:hypothetical protein